MSQTDLLLKNNEAAARGFTKGNLPLRPSRKLSVLACMDARLDVHKIRGSGRAKRTSSGTREAVDSANPA